MICRILAYTVTIFSVTLWYQSADILIFTKIALCFSLIITVVLTQYWTPLDYLLFKEFSSSMRKFLLNGLFIQALINTSIVLFSRIDIFLLMYFVDAKGVGLYFAANSVAMAFPLLTRSLMNYYLQKISVSSNLMAYNLLRKQLYFLPVIIVVACALYFSSNQIMTFIFGINYSNGGLILSILAIGYLGGIVFTPFEAFFYNRNPAVILKVKIASVLVMVASSLLLVGNYGVVGIAFGLMLAKVAGWLIVTIYYSRESINEYSI
jgi:O-antigen/teichoic acid export membrane protein